MKTHNDASEEGTPLDDKSFISGLPRSISYNHSLFLQPRTFSASATIDVAQLVINNLKNYQTNKWDPKEIDALFEDSGFAGENHKQFLYFLDENFKKNKQFFESPKFFQQIFFLSPIFPRALIANVVDFVINTYANYLLVIQKFEKAEVFFALAKYYSEVYAMHEIFKVIKEQKLLYFLPEQGEACARLLRLVVHGDASCDSLTTSFKKESDNHFDTDNKSFKVDEIINNFSLIYDQLNDKLLKKLFSFKMGSNGAKNLLDYLVAAKPLDLLKKIRKDVDRLFPTSLKAFKSYAALIKLMNDSESSNASSRGDADRISIDSSAISTSLTSSSTSTALLHSGVHSYTESKPGEHFSVIPTTQSVSSPGPTGEGPAGDKIDIANSFLVRMFSLGEEEDKNKDKDKDKDKDKGKDKDKDKDKNMASEKNASRGISAEDEDEEEMDYDAYLAAFLAS